MYNGHIKLFRRLMQSPYYEDSQYIHLWVHLLLSVNWTEKKFKLKNSDKFITLLPGQVLTSRDALQTQTGIHRSKIDRILNAFKSEQQIEQQTFSKYRVITILNWQMYQCVEQQNEQHMSHKRAADEPQMSTNKKVKNIKKEPIGGLLPICQAWKAFVEMRRSIKKPMTSYAEKLKVSCLQKLIESGQDPIAVLNQSIGNNWQDLFPIKVNAAEQKPASTVTTIDPRYQQHLEGM